MTFSTTDARRPRFITSANKRICLIISRLAQKITHARSDGFASASPTPRPSRRGSESKSIGPLGEDLAAKELARRGIHVVARNRRVAGVEIDILGFDRIHDDWVIVEVKTSARNTRPEAHLGPTQRRRLERAGIRLGFDQKVRIVVVAVDLTRRPPRIGMFEVD